MTDLKIEIMTDLFANPESIIFLFITNIVINLMKRVFSFECQFTTFFFFK